jgi:hypothetical protein
LLASSEPHNHEVFGLVPAVAGRNKTGCGGFCPVGRHAPDARAGQEEDRFMQPTAKDAPRRGRGVEITQRGRAVQVTLTLSPDRTRVDRRMALEKARRMLAAALEEERAAARPAPEPAPAKHPRADAPGCGAWWAF